MGEETGAKDSLGDRMKRYEAVTRRVLPRRTYSVIRVDGRAFHSLLKGAERPFDLGFIRAMDGVGLALCQEISGAQFAFVQSDEVSVLVTDFGSLNQEPWFGGVEAKQVSISAAVATAAFNKKWGREKPGVFDSRVYTIPDQVEVANYFLWRQRDTTRNSITMTAQNWFSHEKLQGVNTDQMLEMLWAEHKVNWAASPEGFKRGRVVEKNPTTSYTDGSAQWDVAPAQEFEARSGNWLARVIPEMPRFA